MEEHVYRQLYELEDAHWWFRGRRAVIASLMDRAGLAPAPRILDVGCGTGRNLSDYRRLGSASGVEPSSEAVAFCHARGLRDVVQAGLECLPFADASFDLATATDVLEHIQDDRAAAAELRRVVAPGGRLVVTVPAYQWLWSSHDDSHHHFRRYTASRLRAVLAPVGWRPIVQTYFNSLLLPPIALVRARSRIGAKAGAESGSDYEKAPRSLNAALSLPMRAEAQLIRRGARLPAGVSIGMVCEAR